MKLYTLIKSLQMHDIVKGIDKLYMHTVCVHVRATSTLRVSQNKVFKKNECLPWILSKKVPHPVVDIFPVYAT